MNINTIYIDDKKEDLDRYKRKFVSNEKTKNIFDLKTYQAQDFLEHLEGLSKDNIDLFLVDLRLDKPFKDEITELSGASLSTVLREKYTDIPIVLFTRKSVFKEISDFDEVLSSIDNVYYKGKFFREKSEDVESLINIVKGYNELRKIEPKTWNSIFTYLDISEEEKKNMKQTNFKIDPRKYWKVSEAANWFRNVFLKYPGIVYNSVFAATFLGIKKEEFHKEEVQKFFDKAKYNGPFSYSKKRWWKSKLIDRALSIMNDKERNQSLKVGFPKAWYREKGFELENSNCVFSEKSPADTICYVLEEPVKYEYTLPYQPDNRPNIMEEARISFEAIKTTNDYKNNNIPSEVKDLLRRIKESSKEELI